MWSVGMVEAHGFRVRTDAIVGHGGESTMRL